MKTLIADDHPENRYLLSEMLAGLGECVQAINGLDAVERFLAALKEGAPFDLVLMDVIMPELDGQSAVRQIRDLEREQGVSPKNETTIIMVTALDSATSIIEAYYHSGCSDYLTKPLDMDALMEKLRAHRLLPTEPAPIAEPDQG